MEIRSTASTVEIFHNGERVASHAPQPRAVPSHHHSTSIGPRAISGTWSGRPRACVQWAGTIGPATAQCSTVSWPVSRIRRWVIVPAWVSSGWAIDIRTQRVEAAARARRGDRGLLLSEREVDAGTQPGRSGSGPVPDAPPPSNMTTSAVRLISIPGNAHGAMTERENIMLTQPTIEKLMPCACMAWRRPSGTAAEPEITAAELRRTVRAAGRPAVELAREPGAGAASAQGRLQGPACVEDIDYRTPRGLDRRWCARSPRNRLGCGEHQNIFLLGPTGIGKSWLACAFAQKACRDGYTALFSEGRRTVSRSGLAVPTAACANCSIAGPPGSAGRRRLGHGAAGRSRASGLSGNLRDRYQAPLD